CLPALEHQSASVVAIHLSGCCHRRARRPVAMARPAGARAARGSTHLRGDLDAPPRLLFFLVNISLSLRCRSFSLPGHPNAPGPSPPRFFFLALPLFGSPGG